MTLLKTPTELQHAVQRIVEAVGTPSDNAAIVAQLLVGSHLAGHDSHGIQHLPRYVQEVRAGEIVAQARPEVMRETASTALVRGNWTWGHVTADFVTRLGIRKARENGVALISAVEVNHIGRLGEYVEQATREGVVGVLVSGGNAEELATAAPYGGRKALLAPNPIAIGFPVAEEPPLIVDFATTRVAGGKVALAKAKGESVPLGWIIDSAGEPSTHPDDYYNGGALLPFGEHKGFGIMVAIEILGRILAGADAFADTPHGGTYFRHVGITLIAIDSGVFSSTGDFGKRTAELAARGRAVPPASGFERVLMPGDFEHANTQARRTVGIEIPEATWEAMRQTAALLGVVID